MSMSNCVVDDFFFCYDFDYFKEMSEKINQNFLVASSMKPYAFSFDLFRYYNERWLADDAERGVCLSSVPT